VRSAAHSLSAYPQQRQQQYNALPVAVVPESTPPPAPYYVHNYPQAAMQPFSPASTGVGAVVFGQHAMQLSPAASKQVMLTQQQLAYLNSPEGLMQQQQWQQQQQLLQHLLLLNQQAGNLPGSQPGSPAMPTMMGLRPGSGRAGLPAGAVLERQLGGVGGAAGAAAAAPAAAPLEWASSAAQAPYYIG
jgi:hypothetical protein